jgi:hypothetical protein
MKKILIFLFFGLLAQNVSAVISISPAQGTSIVATPTTTAHKVSKWERTKAYFKAVSTGEKSGIVAALLCFVLGGIGVHRVFMGSKPIIILWYMISLGGIFGVLPLIDFFRLLFGGAKHYQNNDRFLAAFQ